MHVSGVDVESRNDNMADILSFGRPEETLKQFK